jgi:hypothetical protein
VRATLRLYSPQLYPLAGRLVCPLASVPAADSDVFFSHHYAPTTDQAVADIVAAGTDVDCGGFMTQVGKDISFIQSQVPLRAYNMRRFRFPVPLLARPLCRACVLPCLVVCASPFLLQYAPSSLASGNITEADIDVLLKRLFRVRIRLGQFDPPGPLSTIGVDQVWTWGDQRRWPAPQPTLSTLPALSSRTLVSRASPRPPSLPPVRRCATLTTLSSLGTASASPPSS